MRSTLGVWWLYGSCQTAVPGSIPAPLLAYRDMSVPNWAISGVDIAIAGGPQRYGAREKYKISKNIKRQKEKKTLSQNWQSQSQSAIEINSETDLNSFAHVQI